MTEPAWCPVVGYEDRYSVSAGGQVRNANDKIIRGSLSVYGYLRVGLWKSGKAKWFTIHSLVAAAFIGPRPEGLQIDHIDGNKLNNAATNLRLTCATSLNSKTSATVCGSEPMRAERGTADQS